MSLRICCFNDKLGCDNPKCSACGWNPAVSQSRIRKIKEERAAKARWNTK